MRVVEPLPACQLSHSETLAAWRIKLTLGLGENAKLDRRSIRGGLGMDISPGICEVARTMSKPWPDAPANQAFHRAARPREPVTDNT
jgi:hypothetical protein